MKTVHYSCPFVPAEWIAAHGLRPRRLMPCSAKDASAVDVTFGVCTYVRAFIHEAASDTKTSAIVLTTVCDQMRRAPEQISRLRDLPTFLMNVPSTWQTPAAERLYRDELERLGRFLVRLGGETPSNERLTEVMLDYDARRSLMVAARGGMTPRAFSEGIAAFHRDGAFSSNDDVAKPEPRGVPLALIGGPMLQEDFAIFDFVQQARGRIVLDATETGERTLPAPFDRQQLRNDPLNALVRAYFGTIPDVSRRPNSGLYERIRREIDQRGVRGVIYRRHVWCDLWHAELHRMREQVGVPVLDIDGGHDDERTQRRWAGRVQAFLEMLT
jgi:benzoyl-CoA reductase/2-hydroxyglutaryl-CoA dehydratase subunit BcrC/BadD/HgdB